MQPQSGFKEVKPRNCWNNFNVQLSLIKQVKTTKLNLEFAISSKQSLIYIILKKIKCKVMKHTDTHGITNWRFGRLDLIWCLCKIKKHVFSGHVLLQYQRIALFHIRSLFKTLILEKIFIIDVS